jgi:hypothetical protein
MVLGAGSKNLIYSAQKSDANFAGAMLKNFLAKRQRGNFLLKVS